MLPSAAGIMPALPCGIKSFKVMIMVAFTAFCAFTHAAETIAPASLVFDPDHWSIGDEGQLVPRKGSGMAYTRRRYSDFTLELEFNVEEKSNSGVFFRVPTPGGAIDRGLELQVLDSYGSDRMFKGMCGALYDLAEPRVNAVNPAGEWNAYVLECRGPNIKATLNDELILDLDLNDWTEVGKNPDGTKNKYSIAGKDKSREGLIGLQDHHDKVRYRNIRVKPHAPSTPEDPKYEPNIVDGWEILFDGTDTDAWRLDTNAWVIRDGALCFLGGVDPACTPETYGDFELKFEFRPQPNQVGAVEVRRMSSGHWGSGLALVIGDNAKETELGKRSVGALKDACAPAAKPVIKPREWNTCHVTCRGPGIVLEINGTETLNIHLDEWTEKNKNPDGSDNRYWRPLKEWPREGGIGFCAPLEYRNITITGNSTAAR